MPLDVSVVKQSWQNCRVKVCMSWCTRGIEEVSVWAVRYSRNCGIRSQEWDVARRSMLKFTCNCSAEPAELKDTQNKSRALLCCDYVLEASASGRIGGSHSVERHTKLQYSNRHG